MKENLSETSRLIPAARSGDEAAMEELLSSYKWLVRLIAKQYFMAGAEEDDLIQEGMIGLFKAVRDFDPEKNVPFSNFAGLCIRRQINKAVEKAKAGKNAPLNEYISLADITENGEVSEENIIDKTSAESTSRNPLDLLIEKETLERAVSDILSSLSSFERTVFEGKLHCFTNREIADSLSVDVRSVDNAVQRIKAKYKKLLLL
ncbi:MAG: sigma-70 family RNA polymerase sigma factor [Lachnospiraceae bacterium]|jgi:RNA polymerase sporulation-specific sigma factor|nr:sigma-70 family RNA polymerase sigma factor [Lachnospiraceae bacterium]MEE3461889.1 sigma-70 family RNA polymerase sigma factor [Lachnospiraceae bacterium]